MNKRITCLIVDDEPLAREALRRAVADDPELEIVGQAADGVEAVTLIERLSPDLVFLDILMAEVGGFEVLQALELAGLRVPVIVFVTAYDQYAIQAFEAHALDYLLKPLDRKRFHKAVAAAKSRIAADRAWYTAAQLVDLLAEKGALRRESSRLPIKSKGKILFVRLSEVEWIEAQGNYLRLHSDDEEYLLRETMNAFEAKLDPDRFMRIHRSTIVNVERIKAIEPWFTGEYVVRMASGREFTLTRSYKENLRRLMGGTEKK